MTRLNIFGACITVCFTNCRMGSVRDFFWQQYLTLKS